MKRRSVRVSTIVSDLQNEMRAHLDRQKEELSEKIQDLESCVRYLKLLPHQSDEYFQESKRKERLVRQVSFLSSELK